MPLQLSEGNCQYTQLTTAGTTTLNPGQSGVPGPGQQGNLPASFGVLYGASVVSAGTGFGATLVDIVPPTGLGSNTAATTNTLLAGTGGTSGQSYVAGLQGVGVRYKGALVAIAVGTPGQVDVFWD